MQKIDLHRKIWAYMLQMKGKKKLKEKDVIRAISGENSLDNEIVKANLRRMIDKGVLMYSYGGGASSVEIPSAEYLAEKGIADRLDPMDPKYTTD